MAGKLINFEQKYCWDFPNSYLATRDEPLKGMAIIDLVEGEWHRLPSLVDCLEEFRDELSCHHWLSHHVSLQDVIMEAIVGEASSDR